MRRLHGCTPNSRPSKEGSSSSSSSSAQRHGRYGRCGELPTSPAGTRIDLAAPLGIGKGQYHPAETKKRAWRLLVCADDVWYDCLALADDEQQRRPGLSGYPKGQLDSPGAGVTLGMLTECCTHLLLVRMVTILRVVQLHRPANRIQASREGRIPRPGRGWGIETARKLTHLTGQNQIRLALPQGHGEPMGSIVWPLSRPVGLQD
ncbi:hypothetical protein SAMD00023353_9200320 [Rosellinia necatrix]|uniref:Uncharacterized protein n=1 Tax=Rosellinia necatrix TaxID=77044 RepID=A0A1S8AC37_ROSNE|nr:hypothetical protein SAMD00023353_9200320 [Rosellinia necatrix]